ncbi:MAG: hypothetical protein DHS20C21_10510 [Gemmatimonadota bacterium]|nr:MAG: hypothetical protein DHS20C21_10510 [Gemmatimonadota bacterium]
MAPPFDPRELSYANVQNSTVASDRVTVSPPPDPPAAFLKNNDPRMATSEQSLTLNARDPL